VMWGRFEPHIGGGGPKMCRVGRQITPHRTSFPCVLLHFYTGLKSLNRQLYSCSDFFLGGGALCMFWDTASILVMLMINLHSCNHVRHISSHDSSGD